jgi:hypothetical protein
MIINVFEQGNFVLAIAKDFVHDILYDFRR